MSLRARLALAFAPSRPSAPPARSPSRRRSSSTAGFASLEVGATATPGPGRGPGPGGQGQGRSGPAAADRRDPRVDDPHDRPRRRVPPRSSRRSVGAVGRRPPDTPHPAPRGRLRPPSPPAILPVAPGWPIAHDELGDLGRSFDGMAAALERGEAERRRFMQDAVHELRTPLAVIEATTSAVLDGVYAHDDEHLRTVRDQARLLSRIVDDLRTISLAEGGRLELRREEVDVDEVIGGVARDFEARAGRGRRGARRRARRRRRCASSPTPTGFARSLAAAPRQRGPPHAGRGPGRRRGPRGGRPARPCRGPGHRAGDRPRGSPARLRPALPGRPRTRPADGLERAGPCDRAGPVEAHGGRVGAGSAPEGGALVWLELPRA